MCPLQPLVLNINGGDPRGTSLIVFARARISPDVSWIASIVRRSYVQTKTVRDCWASERQVTLVSVRVFIDDRRGTLQEI